MQKKPYKVACSRIVGRSHEATQTPCQDFVSARSSASMASMALADGAGSRPRSEIGAEVVVQAILKILSRQFDLIDGMCASDPDAAKQYIHRHLINALNQKAIQHGCSVDALASTLLFVAHKGGRFIAGHIGDGVIAQVDMTGKPHTLSHPDNGEYANTTVFVTDASAISKFRLFCGASDVNLAGFALMSDGCAESLYDKKTGNPATAIAKLLAWNTMLSRKKMTTILATHLEQMFSQKSSDDCSLAILSILRVT